MKKFLDEEIDSMLHLISVSNGYKGSTDESTILYLKDRLLILERRLKAIKTSVDDAHGTYEF